MNWVEALRQIVEGGSSAPTDSQQDYRTWTVLVDIMHHRAALLAGHLGLNKEDAEEAAQDVMFKLCTPDGLRKVASARSPEGYLIVVLRNQLSDIARRKAKLRECDLTLVREHMPTAYLPKSEADSSSIDRQDALRFQLQRMSPRDRMLLVLRYWRGMSIAEIAQREKAPYSRVAVRLFRLVRRLRERLKSNG